MGIFRDLYIDNKPKAENAPNPNLPKLANDLFKNVNLTAPTFRDKFITPTQNLINNLKYNEFKGQSIGKLTPELQNNSTQVQEVNWEQYGNLKNDYENAKANYGEYDPKTIELENQLNASFVPEDKQFSLKKDVIAPLIVGAGKGLTFGMGQPDVSKTDLQTSDTTLAKGSEFVGNVAASFLPLGGINKAAEAMMSIPKVAKVFEGIANPILKKYISEAALNLAVNTATSTPMLIKQGMDEGKTAEEILGNVLADDALNVGLGLALSKFTKSPELKQAYRDYKAGKIAEKDLKNAVETETQKALSQIESDKLNRENINNFKQGKITQEEFTARQNEIYQQGIDSGKAYQADGFGNVNTRPEQLGLPEVKNSQKSFVSPFVKYLDDSTYNEIKSMNPVSSLKNTDFQKSNEVLSERVARFFSEKYNNIINNSELGDVVIAKQGIDDSISHGLSRNKAIAFKAVPEIIQKGKIINVTQNWKGRNYDTYVISAPFKIGNDKYVGFVVVKKDAKKNSFYLHEVEIEKELDGMFKTGQSDISQGSGKPSSSSNGSIPNSTENVNTEIQSIANNPLYKVDPNGKVYEYNKNIDGYLPNGKQIEMPQQAPTQPTINEPTTIGVIAPTAENTIKSDLNAPIVTEKQINLLETAVKNKYGDKATEKLQEITAKYGVDDVSKLTQKQMNEALYKDIKYKAEDVTDILSDGTDDIFKDPKKIHLFDYLRTPTKVLEKIGLGRVAEKLKQAYNNYLDELPKEIDKVTQWYERVKKDPTASQRIFQYLDRPKGSGMQIMLSAEELQVAKEIETYLKNWADRLKLPEEKRISNYITHIFKDDFIQKDFDENIAKLIVDKVPSSVYDQFTRERLGKQGYVEDVFQALDAYVKKGVRKVNMDPALKALSEASKGQPLDNWQYIKALGDRINIRPTHVDSLIDNTIKSIPFIGYKLGARPVTNISKKARQMVYRGTLGLNIGSAVRNLTQGVNTYAKLGERWTAKGYIDNVRAMFKGSDELERVGVLRDTFIQDRALSATKKTIEKIDKGLFSMFEFAERMNRGAAYYGAKARALSQGLNEEQAIKKGVEMAGETQFKFGSIDTPVFLQNDIAKTLLQFQSFNVKQAEFLADMVKKKEWAGLARFVGANMVVLGTVGQLLGMKPLDFIPFSGVATGDTKLGETPITKAIKDGWDVFTTTKDQYGNEIKQNTGERLLEVAANDLPAFIPAGVQVKKTVQGLDAVNQGGSFSKSGRLQYAVPQTPENYARAAVFGKSNLSEAQKYFDNTETPLGENQTAAFKYATKNGIKNTDFYNAVKGMGDLKPLEGKKGVNDVQKRKYLATQFKGDNLRLMIALLVDTEKGKKIMGVKE